MMKDSRCQEGIDSWESKLNVTILGIAKCTLREKNHFVMNKRCGKVMLRYHFNHIFFDMNEKYSIITWYLDINKKS